MTDMTDSAIVEPGIRAGDDLSALAWVHGELRKSLDTAHKALRRYLRDAESVGGSDVDAVDPSILRGARTQLHQGVGALELVGLPAVADVLRASELAVQRMISKPAIVNLAAVEVLEHVSFALLDFLGRQLAGKPVSPVALFPQYRAALQLAAADRIHPADLWKIDWHWLELPADTSATSRNADDEARGAMETMVLAQMRETSPGAGHATQRHLSNLCAELGAGARRLAAGRQIATLWQLAAAVFEAQADGLLDSDAFTKRIGSRLLSQLRSSMRGESETSDRLAQDLLFFCSHARAPAADQAAPRLAAVRQAWRLADLPTADYETPRLGRFDPALLSLARKRVAAARDSWAAAAGGEKHRIAALAEQFTLVGESLTRLFPSGDVLAQSLQQAVAYTVNTNTPPPPALAMEVATGILYLDASLEDGDFDQPELAARVQRLARRIDEVRVGADPQPLDLWMEELYRRVSDRQTMGSVVQELRSSLSEVEKQIDQYFRNPAERQVLIPVPAQLSAMRGVFSVLGLSQASAAVLHMRDDVDALAETEVDPQRAIQAGTFDRLADNLGALSFLIDMLSVQPQLAKSLFRFDPETGSLSAVMGQTERVSAFAGLDELAAEAPPSGPEPAPAILHEAASPPAAPAPPGPSTVSGLEDDVEMRDIFIEEAREVVTDARAALERLADAPENAADMTHVRRAFHTLKGSSRMVGLRDFGEAAWGCEQLYNSRLAQAPRMDGQLRILTGEALAYLGDWAEAIAAGRDGGHHSAAVAKAADALRLEGARLPIELPAAPTAAAPAAVVEAPRLVLDLSPEPEPTPAAPQPALVDEPAFILTLPDEAVPAEEAAGADAPTLILLRHIESHVEVAAETPALAALSLDDEAPLDKGETTELLPLLERLPELPSAADLDLSSTSTPAAAPADTLGFSFDLDDEAAAAPTVPLPGPSPAAPEPPLAAYESTELLDVPLDMPAPLPAATPGVESFELDLEDMADLFEAAPPAAVDPRSGAMAADERVERPVEVPAEEPATDLALDFAAPSEPSPELAAQPQAFEEEPVRVIGPLRISIPLFNIFLNEADELSRRLVTELAEWAIEYERHPVPESCSSFAHSLAGNSGTVGYSELSALARALEHALIRSHDAGNGRAEEGRLFTDAAEEIRRLLHQFAAGFLHGVHPELMARLAEHERLPIKTETEVEALDLAEEPALLETPEALEAADLELPMADEPAAIEPAPPPEMAVPPPVSLVESLAGPAAERPGARADAFDDEEDIDAVDAIDTDLFPIFEEEAEELLPQLQSRLRDWFDQPGDAGSAAACMRTLHTFKGGARLSGAMRLGEMAHRLETAIEHLSARESVHSGDIEPLLARGDRMSAAFEALRKRGAPAPAPAPLPAAAAAAVPAPMAAAEPLLAADLEPVAPAPVPEHAPESAGAAAVRAPAPPVVEPVAIDWTRFPIAAALAPEVVADRAAAGAGAAVRVRAALLDRLVNQAGEVSITRARIDSDVKSLQGSLGDLTDSLERLRRQLRDIELQAESQISTRMEAAKAAAQAFDPLEMDRFTRFQELTRFMAESVNDVGTLQRSLQRTLQSTEDQLAAQARLTRDLQDDLLRTRMVEFESAADRLYRTVRQAAKETAKQVKLDIVGGAIEIDRGVLERMIGSFEHLLRNSVAHGVELPEARLAAGKDASGLITITVAQSGNEVAVEFADDGGGLHLARVRERAIERGLLAADAERSDDELAQLIFTSGFSTAESVTELAGRGVGLDVVRAEVNGMGGRIEISTTAGRGTRFRLLLPLTTAVTQVVLMRCGEQQVAVPSTLIETVRRVPSAEVERGYTEGKIEYAGQTVPFFWLASLLRGGMRGDAPGRTQAVVVIRSASQRVAIHVDEVIGNQEVVVKNVGPQLARMPGLAGVTLLPSGAVALIYNPVALATVYADAVRERMRAPQEPRAQVVPLAPTRTPMVMVVDDSLTVRRVTQRLLAREGYRVVTAKDGLDALERLAEERPVILLSDIEMPRMDGFDLVRNVRADPKLAGLPVVMISSRIAQKHRDYAAELGVDHFLGKPYSEEELLSLVARYAGADILT